MCVSGVCANPLQREKGTHAGFEDCWKLRKAIQHEGDDSKADVGAQDTKGSNAGQVSEELLLLD